MRKYKLKKSSFSAAAAEDNEHIKFYTKWALKKFDKSLDLNELVTQYQNNKDPKLLEKILIQSQSIIFKCASTYAKPGYLFDYVSEGQIGVINAVNKYDGRGSFLSFAITCITRQYQDFVNTASFVNYHLLSSTIKEMRNLIKENKEESVEKLSKKLKFPINKNQLDYFTMNTVECDESVLYEFNEDNKEFADVLFNMFGEYCKKSKLILEYNMLLDYFGFTGVPLKYADLACKYDISNVKAASIINKMIGVLRKYYDTHKEII